MFSQMFELVCAALCQQQNIVFLHTDSFSQHPDRRAGKTAPSSELSFCRPDRQTICCEKVQNTFWKSKFSQYQKRDWLECPLL